MKSVHPLSVSEIFVRISSQNFSSKLVNLRTAFYFHRYLLSYDRSKDREFFLVVQTVALERLKSHHAAI